MNNFESLPMVDHAQVTPQAREVHLPIHRDQDVAGFNTPGEKGKNSQAAWPLLNSSMHKAIPDQLPTRRLRLLTTIFGCWAKLINRILFITFASSQRMFCGEEKCRTKCYGMWDKSAPQQDFHAA